ncbi:MAG: alpha-amylase family glycosyl hydrolase [Daejeonella sp.]
MRRILFLVLACSVFFSCSKKVPAPQKQTPVVIAPNPDVPVPQYGQPFANVPNREDVTIYQVNMRVFSESGNFEGVKNRLDSIKSLGANVVYLMPVFPVGSLRSVNSPYCVKNYTEVNPEFGTLNDLRSLVETAHSKNMSVILDWVANHTAWDNPWISSHKDWYLQDATGAVVSPPGTGWNDVAQLNFNNAAMRLEMIRSMKYWVYAANVDGFRCDYADGPPLDFWKQAIDSLRNISTHKLLIMAEGNRNANFTVGFDYNFGFSYYGNLKNIYNNNQTTATSIDNLNNTEYASSTGTQQVVRYTSNHDVNGSDGTPQELFGGLRGSMSAFVVSATMKSVPMIYNGQEVGTPYRLSFPFTGTNIDWSLNPGLTAEYKKIIAFRNNNEAVRKGQLTSYSITDAIIFTKETASNKILVISNMRNKAIDLELSSALQNSTWTNEMNGAAVDLGTQLSLQPYSYLLLKKR